MWERAYQGGEGTATAKALSLELSGVLQESKEARRAAPEGWMKPERTERTWLGRTL